MNTHQNNIQSRPIGKVNAVLFNVFKRMLNHVYWFFYFVLYVTLFIFERIQELIFPKKTPFLLDGETFSKGVVYDANGRVKRCLFCDIVAGKEPAAFVESNNDHFRVFKTIDPATSNHLLVVPVKHIRSIFDLEGESGIALIENMLQVGIKALGHDAVDAQFCFHVPPNTSIDHIHMHAIGNKSSMGFLESL